MSSATMAAPERLLHQFWLDVVLNLNLDADLKELLQSFLATFSAV